MKKLNLRARLKRWWRDQKLQCVSAFIITTTLGLIALNLTQVNEALHSLTWGGLNQFADYMQSASARKNVDLRNITWDSLAVFATLMTVLINVILLTSVIVGFKSVKEGQAARSADILVWAMAQMDAIKADERKVRNADTDFTSWDQETIDAALRTRNAYQRMCYFARKGLIDKQHFRALWGINIALYWRVLSGFVYSERKRFGDSETAEDGAYLAADFEALALEFFDYYSKRHGGLIQGYLHNVRDATPPGPHETAPPTQEH